MKNLMCGFNYRFGFEPNRLVFEGAEGAKQAPIETQKGAGEQAREIELPETGTVEGRYKLYRDAQAKVNELKSAVDANSRKGKLVAGLERALDAAKKNEHPDSRFENPEELATTVYTRLLRLTNPESGTKSETAKATKADKSALAALANADETNKRTVEAKDTAVMKGVLAKAKADGRLTYAASGATLDLSGADGKMYRVTVNGDPVGQRTYVAREMKSEG